MGFIGRLLGSEKALAGIVGSVTSGLDKLRYTAEEKAEDNAKLLQRQADIRLRAQEQVIEWQKATAGQNVTRRVIALLIVGIWASAYLIRLAMLVAAVWWDSSALQLERAAGLIDEGISDIEPSLMLVLGFYFALGGISDTVAAYKKKKDGEG